MKKLMIAVGLFLSGIAMSQDTLTTHFSPTGSPVLYSIGYGYLSGHNDFLYNNYGHKFDNGYGVDPTMDSITGVLLNFAVNEGTSQAEIKVYDDNAGEPGNVIGQTTLMHSDISGSSLGNAGPNRDYNAIASFSPAIEIPSDDVFYVTVELTYGTAGDSMALWTTLIGEFPDASSHTLFYQPSQQSWRSMSYMQADVALAIFPVIDAYPVDTNSVGIDKASASNINILNVEDHIIVSGLKPNAQIELFDLSGRLVFSKNAMFGSESIPTQNIPSGIYVIHVTDRVQNTSQKIRIK